MQIRRLYNEQLNDLRREVVRLGAMTGEAIGAGTQALLASDLALAERVVAGDQPIDDLAHVIEGMACQLMALQQPTASDLRYLVTVLRVVHEIERSGDLMTSIAKSARRLYPDELAPRMRGIIDRMGTQAATQLELAIDAFATGNADRAAALDDMDDVMDELQRDLYRAIFDLDANDERALHRAVQVALLARFFERIADHAVNIGHRVRFMVTGRFHFETEGG
ncbi:MAG: phosphate signaling complex protein PhoU, partial [Acidimicrobiia bacterium]